MSTTQNSKTQIFIDYIPAELKENITWEIVYYVKNPFTEELVRKRNRVRPLKSITERRKLAKRMIQEINSKLEKDPNSFFSVKGSKEFSTFNDVVMIYLNQLTREVKDSNLSIDTLKTYTSRCNNIQLYIKEKGLEKLLCFNFNNDFIIEYLDYLRYTKNVSARTRDNYFTFIRTLSGWMLQKKYIIENPCEGISKINKKKNEKIVIPKHERELIFDYYRKTNYNFFVFCMCCYYCLIRRTELSKIKVSDVNLKNSTLFISAEDSKNNKSSYVTIPPKLAILLSEHIQYSQKEHYLFSNDNYKPGVEKFKPNKASNNWRRMRKKIGVNPKIKWYYLKDTGIVDLIIAGVPLSSIRDQARHHCISQTNEYIPRNMKKADTFITNSGVEFLSKPENT
jgi:integrase